MGGLRDRPETIEQTVSDSAPPPHLRLGGREHEFHAVQQLTRRQCELLQLVAEGYTSKEIAERTKMAVASIDNLVARAARTLKVRNRRDAAALYIASRQHASVPPSGASSVTIEDPERTWVEAESLQEAAPGNNNRSVLGFIVRLLSGPPMSGTSDPHNHRRITFEVLWVAFVAMIGVTALALFTLAIFETFK